MGVHSRLTQRLVRQGCTPPPPARLFSDHAPELRAAVNAYDDARRAAAGGHEPPMSETNKAHLAPMIMAAVRAYFAATAAAEKAA